MKKLTFRLVTLASMVCGQLIPTLLPVTASSTFTETEVDQATVIAVTKPYGTDKFDLLILEQIPGKKKCWSESGADPVVVNPLLLNFDFTGICRRATDSNGYSIRIDGTDYGLDYLVRLVPNGNELLLVGTNRVDSKLPQIVLGRTKGLVRGFMKIELSPGWKFTKRTFGKKVLGHYYFTGTADALNDSAPSPVSRPTEVAPGTNPGSGSVSPIPTVSPTVSPTIEGTPKPNISNPATPVKVPTPTVSPVNGTTAPKPTTEVKPKPAVSPSVTPPKKPSPTVTPTPKPTTQVKPKPTVSPTVTPPKKPTPTVTPTPSKTQ